jgi:hypothetical protein
MVREREGNGKSEGGQDRERRVHKHFGPSGEQ